MTQATPTIVTTLVADLHRDATFRTNFLEGDINAAEQLLKTRQTDNGYKPYENTEFSCEEITFLRITAGKLGKLIGIDLSFSNPIVATGIERGCPAAGCGCPCKKDGSSAYFIFRSSVRIAIPSEEGFAFSAVLARMVQMCIDTAVDASITANITQALVSVTEILASDPNAKFDVGVYLTIENSNDLIYQKAYFALILSGLRGIASRTGEAGYAAEMDSLLAAILSP